MKHNNGNIVYSYSIIRVFTSASKFYDYRTYTLDKVIDWLKDKPINHNTTDESCCVNLYLFFKSRQEFNKYKKSLMEAIGKCA